MGNDAQVSDVDTSVGDASRETDAEANVEDQEDVDWAVDPVKTPVRNFHRHKWLSDWPDKFGDVAGDFTVQQLDGSSWTFSEKWTGCESYVFFTFFNLNADIASASEALWSSRLDELFRKAERNVRYFFMSDDPMNQRVARLSAL